WTHLDVTQAVYTWYQGGQAINGMELQYANESLGCDTFAGDDYGDTTKIPVLTINYVQDTTAPWTGGYVDLNNAAAYTGSPTVAVAPISSGENGAPTIWGSDWSTVNGVGSASGQTAPTFSVDTAGSQLTADTASCGAAQCYAETYFSGSTISNMNDWPTYTAAFKTDSVSNTQFGTISSANSS